MDWSWAMLDTFIIISTSFVFGLSEGEGEPYSMTFREAAEFAYLEKIAQRQLDEARLIKRRSYMFNVKI